MDDLQTVVIGGCVGVAILVFGGALCVFLVVYILRNARPSTKEWEQYARDRGLTFEAQPVCVSGVLDGVLVRITFAREESVDHTVVMTRVRGGPPPLGAEPVWLRVSARGIWGRFEAFVNAPGPAVDTGDAAFEKRFITHASNATYARAFLTEPLRAGLLAFPREATFSCMKDAVLVTWYGTETDASVLDAARRIVARR